MDKLRWRCDPSQLEFRTTGEVPPLETTVGQDRGLDAIALGLRITSSGYNLYVAGPSGTGRTTSIRRQVADVAATRPPAADWCYLHSFGEPAQPVAVRLPAGLGPELARDVDRLIVRCRRDIPKLFESEQYERDRGAVVQRFEDQRDMLIDGLRGAAERLGFALSFTPTGIVTRPLLKPGHPISQDAFDLLPDEQKAEIRMRNQELERKVEDVLLAIRHLERDVQEKLRDLDREAVVFAIGHVLEDLRRKYALHAQLVQHFDDIQADLIEHLDEYRNARRGGDVPAFLVATPSHEHYRVNVLVTTDPQRGAPVVFEPNPTYYNLTGRIDFRATMGAMYTDVSLIRAGALHRANGGYLVLEARDVLANLFSWEALKRALRDGEVRMENLGEQLSAFPTAVLKPQPIPLDVKVVLIGDLMTYLLLLRLDDDFHKLFKVKAQFGPTMARGPASIAAYAGFVSSQVQGRGLLPFGVDAVARVVEQAARLSEDQERLSTNFDAMSEVLIEADHWARQAGVTQVSAAHVDRALAEREHRLNLLEEEVLRLIRQDTINIDTTSRVVGQVNGLSIVDLGDYEFAHPVRITARTGLGGEGVVDVAREAKLSGPTHSKGVMTLTGYLLGAYAQEQPLSVSARLSFEQVYSEVDGDSASSAELYALLSSLSGIPIKQSVAVTGSVNQHGGLQAIGGVTRKIEGYFAVCTAQGLTGEQGVLIPAANVRHLMLKQEVLDAVAAGRFHVWSARTIDEGVALLTGLPAGTRRPDGTYPDGTIHEAVRRHLAALAARLAQFGAHRGGPWSLPAAAVSATPSVNQPPGR